jgi:hypothetical protein
MTRLVRSRFLAAAMAAVLTGCLPGSDGPSIPTASSTPAAPIPTDPPPAKSAAGPAKKAFQRRGAKAQTAPRARSAVVEDRTP